MNHAETLRQKRFDDKKTKENKILDDWPLRLSALVEVFFADTGTDQDKNEARFQECEKEWKRCIAKVNRFLKLYKIQPDAFKKEVDRRVAIIKVLDLEPAILHDQISHLSLPDLDELLNNEHKRLYYARKQKI